jgi:hypothetical protein
MTSHRVQSIIIIIIIIIINIIMCFVRSLFLY